MPFGLLLPLEILKIRWLRMNVEFIIKLPLITHGEILACGVNDTIITFIDALTKRAQWVATSEKNLTAQRSASIFLDSYIRQHGRPDAIVSDRDRSLTGSFWQHLNKLWRTRTKMLTAFHLQTGGQVDMAKSVVERYLRTFAATNERHWNRLLALAEFS